MEGKKKILMVIAPKDFRDEEYFIPKEEFLNAGFDVKTLSKDVDIAKGKLGGETKVDLKLGKDLIEAKNYDAIVFVGGMGALIYENDDLINNLILDFTKNNKIVAAICIAPRVVAASGVLEGKNATVWNGDGKEAEIIEQRGANYILNDVVVNDNFITANGPHAAKEFAKTIIEELNKN